MTNKWRNYGIIVIKYGNYQWKAEIPATSNYKYTIMTKNKFILYSIIN